MKSTAAVAAALVLSGYAPTAVTSEQVDVSFAFLSYTQDYCSGGVANADVGNGNLASSVEFPQYASRPPLNMSHSDEPLNLVPANGDGAMGCDEKSGDTCQQTGSTYYWCNYDQYLCMTKYASNTNEVYSNVATQTSDNDWVFTQFYDNGLDVDQTSKFTRSESKTDSASWSLSSTVDVGYELDITVKVPLEFDSTEKFTTELSTTTTSTETSTSTQSWSAEQDITIPAQSTVKLTWIITKETVTGDYSADVNMPYYAKVWCNSQTNDHYEWFVPAENFLPAAYPGTCTGSTCSISGPFTGIKGVGSFVTLQQCDLGDHTGDSCTQIPGAVYPQAQ
mmetsp:Transcript_37228/g.100669  ORF Transcript_37228/g.100669 Transcript_37228/m.100669 type:complete len:336 (+) Transcript_37228:116-1123(+)|eukprot:CAMPEP_0119479352 /NCGR_PEP_ID=MMETSP1344-20130328/8656_1 /TAXON_ID=236787 /ORGANISM="Florenciella parvula, Strain CCMP2471" /LENGTH=335 /DNA_ID=CAMNT_0007513581 /DNA_START=105 /DNA_END=1112 /DNA_ORIENTATION=+